VKCWIYIAGLAALIAAGCQRGPAPDPRFLDESAKLDLDKASLVLLADVETVKDNGPRSGPSGVRRIEVVLRVQRVMKGELNSKVACATYFFPYGGFEGQLPVWVERGSTGIFALVPGGRCFRVVNDSRAIIKAYGQPAAGPAPLDKLVAEATIPYSCPDIYKAASDIHSVTIPLVGSREARKLLSDTFLHGDSSVRTCSCLVAGLAWRLHESCLDSLQATGEVQAQATSIERTNDRLLRQEEQQLHENPAGWLRTIVESWGVDGALLRLAALLRSSNDRLPPATCMALKGDSASSSFPESLAKGRLRSNGPAEEEAVTQFRKWLDSGCQADWQHLENPLLDP
jgi:hypothetical protein